MRADFVCPAPEKPSEEKPIRPACLAVRFSRKNAGEFSWAVFAFRTAYDMIKENQAGENLPEKMGVLTICEKKK